MNICEILKIFHKVKEKHGKQKQGTWRKKDIYEIPYPEVITTMDLSY